jgi:hypothetical protein
MFVRFRLTQTSLQASLVETRREGGKVRHHHVTSLGSVAVPATVADRVAFWTRVHGRIARLGNRLGPDTGKIIGALHERVPMPTPDEQRELQLENARADERVFSGLADMHASTAADQKALAASVQRASLDNEAIAEANAEKAKAAREQTGRIERGETVSGGLGKPLDRDDLIRIMKQAGMSNADIRHSERAHDLATALGEAEADAVFKKIAAEAVKASNRTSRKLIRRMLAETMDGK